MRYKAGLLSSTNHSTVQRTTFYPTFRESHLSSANGSIRGNAHIGQLFDGSVPKIKFCQSRQQASRFLSPRETIISPQSQSKTIDVEKPKRTIDSIISPRTPTNIFYDSVKVFQNTHDDTLKMKLRVGKSTIQDIKNTKVISSLNKSE
jgi:hypothetical protein